MGRQRKTDGAACYRRKGCRVTIEGFDAAARAAGLTYAQAQVKETCRLLQGKIRLPDYQRSRYRRAGTGTGQKGL